MTHDEGRRVTSVAVRTAPFSGGTWLDETRISTPMSPYPRYAERRSTWRGPGADLVWVCVRTDDPSVFGIGQTRGGAVVEALIKSHFLPLLEYQDPLAAADVAEQLRRAASPYAVGGTLEMAVSAVELAMWDLSARAWGAPLYRLLGGRPGPLPYYLTVPHPDALKGVDLPLLAGAGYVKVPMAYGPADGPARLADNLDRLAAIRALVPDDVPLAVDCFLSWDIPYTVRFAAEAARFGLGWVEEPLAPDDIEGHSELRARLGAVRVAAGEHAFGLNAGLRLLRGRSVDVLQPDVTWCGGIATTQTLAAVAQAQGVLFAPHAAASQPWALHLLAACGPQAIAEVILGLGNEAVPPQPGDGPGVGIDPASVGL
ncbi:enolase C-terminal domain-like protein [Streptomyces aculeolatus]